jgi:anti-anti-sigma regulatory factor
VITVEAEPGKTLLIIRYDGKVTVEETRDYLPKISDALLPFTTGFRLLVDLTNLASMDVACAPNIKQAMDLCQKQGVTEVVRIIPDPTRDIGMQIMSRFHYGPGVRISTCATLAEATALLAVQDSP